MKSVSSVIKGIGSLFSGDYDAGAMLQASEQRLSKSSEVLEVVGMPGWKVIRAEYKKLIEQMWVRQRLLTQDTRKHQDEIQRISDFIENGKLMIGLVDRAVEAHERNLREVTRNREIVATRPAVR